MQARTAARYTTVQFIADHIKTSAKAEEQIAQEVGFDSPKVLSMILAGMVKLPIGSVALLAKALDADPAHLLRLVLEGGAPDS